MENQSQPAIWRRAIERSRASTDAAGGPRRWLGKLPPRGEKNRIVWGHPVKANAAAFHPGSLAPQLPGVCVWMADESGDGDVERLCQIAKFVSDLRSQHPTDPALIRVRDVINDDFTQFTAFALPPEIAGQRQVMMGVTLFNRDRLPIGRVMKAPLPLITPVAAPGANAFVLHLGFWATEIVSAWRAADKARTQAEIHEFIRLVLR